jgi:UDP-N-acetylglucosamine 1-carboxyvinyltransferase
LKLLAATILARDKVILDNIPLGLKDVRVELDMLRAIGADIEEHLPDRVIISWPQGSPYSVVPETCGAVRTSLLFLGALAGRTGYANVSLPGGCDIGERKFDQHFMALEKLGALCRQEEERLIVECQQLKGTDIDFALRTTGGTENALLASVCAEGETRLSNAHTRPEVLDLIAFLHTLGAQIQVLGSGLINLQGVGQLGGGHHRTIYDNMEAMTFSVIAALAGGSVRIRYFPSQDLEIPMIYLRSSGIRLERNGDEMLVERPGIIAPFDLSTGTYPAINSDMQPLFAVLATQAQGTSRITDLRFRDRFGYIDELRKLGADITLDGATMLIRGPTPLRGNQVVATDLRGGAVMVAAALIATGTTVITNAHQIDRGYERFDEKLRALGIQTVFREE